MAKTPRKRDTRPAGTAAEQSALDRPWRIRAAGVVASAVLVGGLIGFVIIPAGQKENAHLSMGHAMARAAGLEAGSPAVPQPVNTATSVPVSTVSWDPAIMRILASGNTARGAQIAAQTCAACHGDKGLSQSMAPGPIFPSLAGQSPYAIYKQLHDFRSGARVNQQMTPIAQMLQVEDLAAVAAYYSAASKEYAAIGRRELLGDPDIERLANEGDSHRRLPACLACHVNNAGGPIETPVITGQGKDYILAQLNAFASGQRKNDVYGRMRDVAGKLTPAERAALARYFEGTL
ncbi:MAG TPA: c-type cytochrome [Sphingomicrobium sp.]